DEGPRVGPVVRDLALVVVAHRVVALGGTALREAGILALRSLLLPRHEPVHAAVVDVRNRAALPVRPAGVDVLGVVERADAIAVPGVMDACRGDAVRVHRDAVRAGEGTEVVIEGTVLLHDDDDVADLADGRCGRAAGAGAASAAENRQSRKTEARSQDPGCGAHARSADRQIEQGTYRRAREAGSSGTKRGGRARGRRGPRAEDARAGRPPVA